jgi:hypothetical protein
MKVKLEEVRAPEFLTHFLHFSASYVLYALKTPVQIFLSLHLIVVYFRCISLFITDSLHLSVTCRGKMVWKLEAGVLNFRRSKCFFNETAFCFFIFATFL